MASYHCTVKAGASASAGAHAAYIEREGKYKSRSGSDLEAVESGNLPDWAERSADFWEASDSHERANAKAYREYEVALPREMTPAQRLNLVREFVRTELGDRHAYTFAIHNPRAALEGGEQPHAHIMFSERVIDGIQRETPEHYFKQSSSKDPARGGCKKVNSARKTSKERKTDLVALRERWAGLQNEHLEKHGHADRVDHRTLTEQGIDRFPAEHLGPKAAAMEMRGHSTWRGQARSQHLADVAELDAIPSLERSIQAARDELAKLDVDQAATLPRFGAAMSGRGDQRRRAHVDLPGRAANGPENDSLPVTKPTTPQPERLDALAGFLRVLEQECGLVIRDAQGLAERSRVQLERERARESQLRERIEGMTPPGLLSRRSTQQKFEDQVRALQVEGQAAVNGQVAAHRGLEKAQDMQASPQDEAIARIKARDPGLVERMVPLLKDAQLVADAKRHLQQQRAAEVAASRARMERQWAEKKARGLEQDRGRGR